MKRIVFLFICLIVLCGCTNGNMISTKIENEKEEYIKENNYIDYDIFPKEERERWETSECVANLPKKVN